MQDGNTLMLIIESVKVIALMRPRDNSPLFRLAGDKKFG